MNKTGIEWCDMTWNPVTGCQFNCPYCYARARTVRFQGYELDGEITTFNPYDGPAVLEEALFTKDKFDRQRRAAFPYGFDPVLYKYRLEDAAKHKTPKTIFVCSMGDLFGDWVPDEWISQVFDACKAAPWHRYLFLTKNPKRYIDLVEKNILPKDGNFWFGSTATTSDDPFWWSGHYNTFVSVEPIMDSFEKSDGLPNGSEQSVKKVNWVIIGAETGNRKDKVIPRKEWIENIVAACRDTGVAVFMKDSIKPFWDGDLITEFPWEVAK